MTDVKFNLKEFLVVAAICPVVFSAFVGAFGLFVQLLLVAAAVSLLIYASTWVGAWLSLRSFDQIEKVALPTWVRHLSLVALIVLSLLFSFLQGDALSGMSLTD
ncbi:MAG TPA: hypothetical protein VMM76_13345 [Pirellulaceae bacterium]|nr:hypothetical protein [Pirellulaceae bacterium]